MLLATGANALHVYGMNSTRRQRVGMAVAATALAALGVDRFVLGIGGPATASAQVVAPETPEAAAVESALKQGGGTSLARRLDDFAARQELDLSGGVPDVFGGEKWTVKSVFGSGVRGGVRIGKDLVRVGQEYRGARLVGVTRTGATFAKSGREFHVPLGNK
jgi:hypothetical protein